MTIGTCFGKHYQCLMICPVGPLVAAPLLSKDCRYFEKVTPSWCIRGYRTLIKRALTKCKLR